MENTTNQMATDNAVENSTINIPVTGTTQPIENIDVNVTVNKYKYPRGEFTRVDFELLNGFQPGNSNAYMALATAFNKKMLVKVREISGGKGRAKVVYTLNPDVDINTFIKQPKAEKAAKQKKLTKKETKQQCIEEIKQMACDLNTHVAGNEQLKQFSDMLVSLNDKVTKLVEISS